MLSINRPQDLRKILDFFEFLGDSHPLFVLRWQHVDRARDVEDGVTHFDDDLLNCFRRDLEKNFERSVIVTS